MKVIASAVAFALVAGSALAAEPASQKGSPSDDAPPLLTWTGFYAGANAGGTWSESTAVNYAANEPVAWFLQSVGALPFNHDLNGAGAFIGGGQLGYNWQFGGNIVAGVEADIQGLTSNSETASTLGSFAFATTTSSRSVDYLGTVRGRVGYAVTPSLLAYATGGLAYGQTNLASTMWAVGAPFVSTQANSDTRAGFTVGGGLEWMFLPNWSARTEYLYYNLGTAATGPHVLPAGGGLGFLASTPSTSFTGHIVRAGANYHFNWGAAPVVGPH